MSYQTVMVVDDDTALLTAVTDLMHFDLPDVHVQPFESPRLALAQFEKQEVATMVTDLKMRAGWLGPVARGEGTPSQCAGDSV
jgi:FixJ family two-component response regulator